jgi:hypothetical protein
MTARERNRKNADKKRALIQQYKLDKGCADCGYNKDARALEFDHVKNSGKHKSGKQRTVASLMYSSWKRIIKEVGECEVVCCNCHAIRTLERKK